MDFASAPHDTALQAEAEGMLPVKLAKLLHQRLGYDRLLNEEVPAVVHLDQEGRLHSEPVCVDASRALRFKLVRSDMRGATYSLLLHHRDLQFTASHDDGTVALMENGDVGAEDRVLMEKLLRHLETASRRTLVRRPEAASSLWQRLFERRRLPRALT